jgi:hypothetical protein
MRHYYIYYRIQPEFAPAIESAIQRMQLEIKAQLGIAGRLLKKRDDPALWMEVYENVAENAAFEDVLRSAESATNIAGLLDPGSKRHIECFQD